MGTNVPALPVQKNKPTPEKILSLTQGLGCPGGAGPGHWGGSAGVSLRAGSGGGTDWRPQLPHPPTCNNLLFPRSSHDFPPRPRL